MTEPSPAARAIVQAFDDRYERCGPFDDNWQELCLAAALRELAEHAAPMPAPMLASEQTQANAVAQEVQMDIRQKIIAIAVALEAPRVQSAKWQPPPDQSLEEEVP